jgi:hypothetical protein
VLREKTPNATPPDLRVILADPADALMLIPLDVVSFNVIGALNVLTDDQEFDPLQEFVPDIVG